MGKDYDVRQLVDGGFEVVARLSHSDPYCLSLGKELIRTQALSKSAALTFQIIGDQPCTVFRGTNGTGFEIYPLLTQAQAVFNRAVANALRLKLIIEAIRLAEGQASEEERK